MASSKVQETVNETIIAACNKAKTLLDSGSQVEIENAAKLVQSAAELLKSI